MKFTVLGMGKTGHTVCAYLLQQGQTVTAWDRDAQKLAVLEQSGIRVSGALEGHFPIHTESSLADAVADSKYILVMTTADGHKPVAERLRGLLQPGQRIIVFNCNWGAYEFDQVLHDELREKQILVGETGGMLLLSNLSRTGECFLRSIKRKCRSQQSRRRKANGLRRSCARCFRSSSLRRRSLRPR